MEEIQEVVYYVLSVFQNNKHASTRLKIYPFSKN